MVRANVLERVTTANRKTHVRWFKARVAWGESLEDLGASAIVDLDQGSPSTRTFT